MGFRYIYFAQLRHHQEDTDLYDLFQRKVHLQCFTLHHHPRQSIIYNNNRLSYAVYACVSLTELQPGTEWSAMDAQPVRVLPPVRHIFASTVSTWADAFGSDLRIDGAEVAILKRNVSF